MDWLQFFSSIFQSLTSLAWPVALVVAVALFRGRLRELLPYLRLKHKDTEISFRLEQAEKEAAQIPKPAPSPELEPTPEETSRFQQVVEHSPRAGVLEKRAELEQVLREVAQPYLKTTLPRSWRTVPITYSIRALRKEGRIDQKTSALLDDLRALGNQAAHGDLAFTKESAVHFGKLTDEVIAVLRAIE
jgi:hypothetical protein